MRTVVAGGSFEKTSTFWRCSNPQAGKLFTVCSGPLSQSIKRGRITREGALDLRESRERRDKIFAEKKMTENAKILDQKQQFSFHFFAGRGKCDFWGGGIASKLASQ